MSLFKVIAMESPYEFELICPYNSFLTPSLDEGSLSLKLKAKHGPGEQDWEVALSIQSNKFNFSLKRIAGTNKRMTIINGNTAILTDSNFGYPESYVKVVIAFWDSIYCWHYR